MVNINIHNISEIAFSKYQQEETKAYVVKLRLIGENECHDITIFSKTELQIEEV